MITGLHHVSLAVADLDGGIRLYRELLGREPSMRSEEDGTSCAYFGLENTTLRLISPRDNTPTADRIRQKLQANQGKLFELAFKVANIEDARQRLKKISLRPEKHLDFEVRDFKRPDVLTGWRGLGFETPFSNGLDIYLVEPQLPSPTLKAAAEAPVVRMDLVVVQTPQPERALAFYGARLDLELIFDRTNADTGGRLAQFSCGDMLIEVSHNPQNHTPEQLDTIWGIGWSVADAEATNRRLAALGRNVSAVKDGAKPGTKKFTVRDGTCGIPTLVVEHVRTP
jgi:catechol 2,3-dioxygenase-like lactoylglutathione lyase family enzyme